VKNPSPEVAEFSAAPTAKPPGTSRKENWNMLAYSYRAGKLESCCLTRKTEVSVVGRTIPSWRMVVEDELVKLKRFRDHLRTEDKAVFDDLLNQCRLYASYAGSTASPVKEIPLILSIMFGQHKRLLELEERILNCTRG
jgi:hypothetical protein